jgi:gluconokinase
MVYLGGGDGPLANLGSGAGAVGAVNIDLGTSGAARVVVDRVTLDDRGRLWCYNLAPGRWAFGGILTNVGNAYQWLATNLSTAGSDEQPDKVLERLNAAAAETAPGSDGLFFLPYLRKVRSPYWDGHLRGAVLGLTAAHDMRHMARAMLEAVAYDLATILEIAAAYVPLKPPVVLTGGLSKSPILPQLLADVIGVEILVPDQVDGSLAGAAIVGLKGAGLIRTLSFETPAAANAKRFKPDPTHSQAYQSLRAEYGDRVAMMQESTRGNRNRRA